MDRAIRDLEATDLRQQKEIADLSDVYKEQAREAASFKVWVADQLKIEFGKINDNFVGAAIALDNKEKRLQGEIDELKKLGE